MQSTYCSTIIYYQKMKRLVLLTALLSIALTSFAQEYPNEVNNKNSAKPIPSKVNDIKLIYSLVHYGYEYEDAISLLKAAQILKQCKYKLPELDADTLLAHARSYTPNDNDLLSLIEKIDYGTFYPKQTDPNGCAEIIHQHGAVGEGKYSLEMVSGYSTDTYTIEFKENKRAIVQVKGVGLTDLDLYIYDKKGKLITSDTGDSDDCECVWTPKWTGEFTIRIKNRGSMYNLYYMQTN